MATTITSITLEPVLQNALADALTTTVDAAAGSSEFHVFDNATPGAGTLLAVIVLNAISFNAASSGTIALNLTPVPGDPDALATGTPLSYQVFDENAGNLMFAGSIASGDTINAGQPVNFSSWTITMPAS